MRCHTLLIPLAFLITGCASTLTPPIQEYTIYSVHHSTVPSSPISSKTLRLGTTKTIPSLTSRDLIYLRANGEIGSYLYTQWSDSPSILIERSLIHTLHENRLFSALIASTSSAQADWILESDIHAFYHRFETNRSSQGVIDISYRLIDAKTRMPIDSKRFFITKNAPSEDAFGGITALSEATQELNIQCSQWLKEKVQ